MAYPDRGLQKAAMGHYLTESARIALEALEPEEDVVTLSPEKQMPAVGPNELLDMPLFSKTPFLPGSNTLFYTTKVGEKLYLPSPTFDLYDPYCKVMAPKYNSLHDPHLRAFYRRKDNLQRLKKYGLVTDKNKVVCSLKEFNEYRQYLTSLKLEFEKHFIHEQKAIEKQVTKLQQAQLLPEAADTSKYRDWLLKEERPSIEEQEKLMRNRYLQLINEELGKLEKLAEENRLLTLAQEDKKKEGLEKRKQLLLRRAMEEEWRKKEMLLLMKIGSEVKREARIEEQLRKTKEDKLKRKQVILEKKMAYHLKKLQERFLKEGFLPPDEIFSALESSKQGRDMKKPVSAPKRHSEDAKSRAPEQLMNEIKGDNLELPNAGSSFQLSSHILLPKDQNNGEESMKSRMHQPSPKTSPTPSKEFLQQESALLGDDLAKKESLETESVSEVVLQTVTGKGTYAPTKKVLSLTSLESNNVQATEFVGSKVIPSASADCVSGGPESISSKVIPSASAEYEGAASACNEGAASGCGSAGCGSKTSCCGSAGCGSKTSCCGSAGCGSKTSCCGSAGCGSKTSCCGSAGCGSKTSCCGSAGCGSKTCCGSAGCGSKTSCCGSAGCGSNTSCCGSAGCCNKSCCCNNGKSACCGSGGGSNGKANPSYDSSGSSRPEASNGASMCPFASMAGGNPSHRTTTKASAKVTVASAASHKAANEGSGKAKQKKREMSVGEKEGQLKERRSSKKRQTEKRKLEHFISASQDHDGIESSYSAYVQYLLSNTDQLAIREGLKGKVSASELNGIIQNVMTWVVSAVTTILYPALTKFEERVRTRVYTVSEESVLSSDNSSSCSTCNEELCEIYGSLPCASTRKVSFTNTSINPATFPNDYQASRKHNAALSSNSTSFTKSTHTSHDNSHFKKKFKRGKTAILVSPYKNSGLLSTTTSVRSSKSDSHITQLQKDALHLPENVSIAYLSKHRHIVPAILKTKRALPKAGNPAGLEDMLFGGEHKPPHANADQKGFMGFNDFRNICTELKFYITKMTAVLLEDIFKRILGDLGFTPSNVSITVDVLLESISESLLGSDSKGTSESGSISRIACFMANDIVANILHKLQAAAQRSYLDILSKTDLATGWKATCLLDSRKHTVPDPTFWRAHIPLSASCVAEEIIDIIIEKLKVFVTSSQTKLYQFELRAKIKATGIPLEQLYAAIPPHTVESDAANSIVKDTIRKIVSKTIASSETDILQSIEEMISRVLSFIQRQTSHEGLLPTRESSIILQLINDVFNSLSTEKLKGFSPMAQSTAGPEMQGGLSQQKARPTMTITTLFTAEKETRKPFPPVNVPGMVIDPDVEGKQGTEPEGNFSCGTKEQKMSVTRGTQGKMTYESFNLESRQQSQAGAKSALHGTGEFLEEQGQGKPTKSEKTENNLDPSAQGAISICVEGEEKSEFPADGMPSFGQPAKATSWLLQEALKKIEDYFKEEEQSLLFETVRRLLRDIFQRIWAAWPICPPAPPPSLAQMSIHRHPREEPPGSKQQTHFSGQTPISDSDISNLAGELVKALFQKVSCAAVADAQGLGSQQPSFIITDMLSLEVDADAAKGMPAVHFRDPEMSFEAGTSKGGPHPNSEDLITILQNLPSKCGLANGLVQTFLEKLENFVTSKVESQFWSDAQNLKASSSSDFPSNIDQDLRKLLETHDGSLPANLEDILHSFNNPVFEKAKCTVLPSYSDLKTYAQEVAKMILQILRHGLDKEVEETASSPTTFSETTAACQIVRMVLGVFSPQGAELHPESQQPNAEQEGILDKLFRKNPHYKSELQAQIHHTVESILNEIHQTTLLDVCSSSSPEKFQTCGTGEYPIPKTATDTTRKPVAKCDVSAVSDQLVDIVLEDLCSALAANMSMKRSRSDQLQPDFAKKTAQPLAWLSSREAKAEFKGHLAEFEKGKHQVPGWSKAEKMLSTKMNQYAAKQLSDLKEVSPEGVTKSLVDNIFCRLESFAEKKLVSELMHAAQLEKQYMNKGRLAIAHSSFPWESSNTHGTTLQGMRDDEAGRYHQKAKLVVRDSQTNLRLCAEKMTRTILQLVQKDLEGEMLCPQNTLPYKENASAREMVNKLLTLLSVQIALTENEVQKRVLKRIFKRHALGKKVTFPLLERVEDVLNQITQRIMGDLGHLPALNNDSLLLGSESKPSACPGVMETASQVHAGRVASEIVDSLLQKMYSVVMDTLFSSSDSRSEMDSSSSNKGPLPTELSCLMDASDIQKMTLALSQLQSPPCSLGEELVQNVLNKIAIFAASHLEEILPLSAHPKWKPHCAFHCDMQASDGVVCRPRTFSEDSEGSLMTVSLSRSDLTIYAKDIVSKVLGTIINEFKTEDYHRTMLRVNTLSSDQISLASNLVHSVVQDLHTDVHLCHLHKHPASGHFRADGFPSTQMYFHLESAMKDTRARARCIFHEEFKSYLKQVLPKEGILKHIFEQQPLTDANIHENLKMLQVSENVVSEVFIRIQDLEASVRLLKTTPGELSEKLFCYSFKRAETPGLPHCDSQAEIGSVARDIVANVFENVQKCLVHCMPNTPGKDICKGGLWTVKHRFTQPEFPFYNISLKASMDTIDRIAKDTVECVVLTLETFVARHFRREFKCNFSEIVNFPLESLSFAQPTRSLHSLSTEIGNGAEAFGNETPGSASRRTLPVLGSAHNLLDFSKLGSTVTKDCIESSFRQIQMLHSELSVYANNAVSSILEIIKRTLDKQLSQKEASLFSSSSESLVLSETISVMLDRCTESLTEITSELMVENLQLEMSGQAFARDKTSGQNPVAYPGVKKTSTRYRRIDLSDSCPPINVPGKVIRLEEEEIKEEIPCRFPSVWDVHTGPERYKDQPCCPSSARARATRRHRQDKDPNKQKSGFLEDDWLPRQRSIPKGSILEKLFNDTEESEAISRIARQRSKADHYKHMPNSQSFMNPDSTYCSPICPVKLAHTAKSIVNTLLCEFGLESEPAVQASCVEKFRSLSPLKEKPPPRTSLSSMFGDRKQQTVFSRWEKRLTDSSEKTNTSTEDSSLLVRDGSSLLSKWDSIHPRKHKEPELLACAHMPEPCEIQMLADHIVLCVIKELIMLTTKDSLEEDTGISTPPWKQKLRERIWRSTYLPSSQHTSSCLDLLWEPLTEAIVSNILSHISNVKPRRSTQERKDRFENTISMFCSVDSYCPEHGMTGSRSPPLNIEELATQISKVIIRVLQKRKILQEPPKRKGSSGKKPKYIYVPPLCLADFDDVYHPLVKEVASLLSLEIEKRSKHGTEGNTGDYSAHRHFPPRSFSRSSQADGKGPSDVRGTICLSTMDQISHKKQRLSCIASNLDRFIHSLKTEESKDIVNKVLHIIFDSLQPAPSLYPEARSQNVVPYPGRESPAKQNLFCSSVCSHAGRLMNKASSNLGLSPKSVLLLDTVSEKLTQALLEKCLTTDKFISTFAFDDFPEDEQIYDVGKQESDGEVASHSRGGMGFYQDDSNSSILTYEIKYSEEPWMEAQSGASSYESALDVLAHTLVKPVITELSLSMEQPRKMNPFCKKSVGFRPASCRKPHAQHTKYGRIEAYSSMPRGRRPESRIPILGGRHARKNAREKNKSLLESTVQHRTFGSRAATPTGKVYARKSFSASSIKKFSRRDVSHAGSDHSPFQPECATVYSATFLEDVISELLVRMYTSLLTKYDSIHCIDLKEMNVLFVNAFVGEFKKAGVRLLQETEEKAYFPHVDSRTINKLVDSILREFGFQLAADKGIVRDISTMAERAAEIVLVEILDHQLPPLVCRRLPKGVYKNVNAETIINRIEEGFTFPRARRQMQPSPAYITILSQAFLERVINQLMVKFFQTCDGPTQKQGKREMAQVDFVNLSSCMADQVMRSIAKHKIWVSKKDDQCRLHSEKDIQKMVDSVYTKILKKFGSQFLIQKDVKCRSNTLVDSVTSFIIQEICHHHLQTFLSADEDPCSGPDAEVLSKNIVKTVLDSVSNPPAAPTGVFPAKQLEETVTRVLSKIFHGSMAKMEVIKGRHEADLHETAKRLANSINLQFGRAPVTGAQKGEDQSLVHPLMDVMDDMVESVCHNISSQQELVPYDVHGPPRDNTAFETIQNWIEKGISDYLLHPLFSGDFLKGSASPLVYKNNMESIEEEFGERQEENQSRSPFNTFLSSGLLKDIITGLLSKIFPSTSSRESTPLQEERDPSDSDRRKLSLQLLDDVRMKLLKHEIRVMKDTHPEQYEYSEEDVQNMTDSLCSKILQKAGSLEAVQRDVKNQSSSLIERIAGFLIGDILKQHVQPFISRQASPAWDTAAPGDSMGRFDIYRTVIKPLDLRQASQEGRERSSPSLFKEIVSGLFSKVADTLSDIPLADSGEELGDTAVRLAKSVTKKLAKSRFSTQDDPKEKRSSSPETRTLVDQMSPDMAGLLCDKSSGHTSPEHLTTLSFKEAAGYQLQSGRPSNLAEVKCFIQKNLFVDKSDSKAKGPVPYKTTVSHQVLEAIIDKLLCLIFPSPSSTSACSTRGGEPYGPDFYNRIAQIKKDIIATVLMQAIWISSYRNDRETNVSEEAMKSMVESVHRDLLHEVLFQQPLPQNRESLSNFYVTKIACFVMNEMFKYHLQSSAAKEASSGTGHHLTIFPYSLLEVMLSQLVGKVFSSPESTGKQIDFSDSNFTEMAANLKSRVITDISAHEIRLVNAPERIPDMDRESEEDIANAIYHQIVCNPESHSEVQNSLLSRRDAVILRVAGAFIREILSYHLCPFLSGSDSSNRHYTKWQQEMEPNPHDVHSAVFLEDVIVAFFCQILSSPDFQAFAKDNHIIEDHMRKRVIEQVSALVRAFNLSNIKVIHCTEEYSYFPQVAAEEVIQISNTIYQKLIEKSGSELEVFKAFQNKRHGLAEQLIPLLIKEVSGYKFQPLLTGDTSTYLFSFLQADAIIDRVETLLPDSTSSSTSFGEKFLKIIHRIFPLWASSGSDGPDEHDPTLGRPMKRTVMTKRMKEDQVSKTPETENKVDAHSSAFLKDTFRGLISKLLSSTTNAYMAQRKGTDQEPLLRDFVEAIVKEFVKSPVKVLQVPEERHAFPAVSETEMASHSRNKFQVWQQDDKVEDFDSEDRPAPGAVFDRFSTSIIRHSSSEASLCDDLTSQNEEVVDRLACYMVRAVSASDFEPGSDSEDDIPCSTTAIRLECDKLIQQFLSDLKLGERKSESSGTRASMVSVLFLEEILSRFLTKTLLAQVDVALPQQKTLSEAEVNDIAHQLKTSVEMQMSKNKITLIPEDQPNLHPDDEEKVNQVVHSVVSNVLEKSGSQKEMYKDIRETKVIFPEEVASIIIGEISSCSTTNPFSENTENETRSALELDRIVSKVVAQMSHHVQPENETSDITMALPDMEEELLPDMEEESPPETAKESLEELLKEEDMPIEIVPYLGDKPLDIDPDFVSDHLAVLSIKTEPLEKLDKRCRSRMGVSLTELRQASMSTKSVIRNIDHQNENKKKERRPSLDFSGHLDVRPREVVCRNSFQCLRKPDISRVELLKDVTSNEDLMVRLVVHDIEDPSIGMRHAWFRDSESDEEEVERVLRAENSFFYDAPPAPSALDQGIAPLKVPTQSGLLKPTGSIGRKKSHVLSKCCPALSSSSSTTEVALRKRSEYLPTSLPQIEITSMPSAHRLSICPELSASSLSQKEVAAVSRSSAIKDSKSTDVKKSKSKDVKKSKSKDVKESKSKDVKESKSTDVKESKSQDVKESKSTDVKESKSKDVKESKSTDVKESKSKDVKESKSTDVKENKGTDVPPEWSVEGEPEEEILDKAVVDMHLSRDTEETPGAFEITSVYQDHNIPTSEEEEEEEDEEEEEEEEEQIDTATDPMGASNSETVDIPRQQSSRFEKISSALSRVFSRTSAINLNNPEPAKEKPTADKS